MVVKKWTKAFYGMVKGVKDEGCEGLKDEGKGEEEKSWVYTGLPPRARRSENGEG